MEKEQNHLQTWRGEFCENFSRDPLVKMFNGILMSVAQHPEYTVISSSAEHGETPVKLVTAEIEFGVHTGQIIFDNDDRWVVNKRTYDGKNFHDLEKPSYPFCVVETDGWHIFVHISNHYRYSEVLNRSVEEQREIVDAVEGAIVNAASAITSLFGMKPQERNKWQGYVQPPYATKEPRPEDEGRSQVAH